MTDEDPRVQEVADFMRESKNWSVCRDAETGAIVALVIRAT